MEALSTGVVRMIASFSVLFLSAFAAVARGVIHMRSISTLNVSVATEDTRDVFIVCVHVLTTHWSLCHSHPWRDTKDIALHESAPINDFCIFLAIILINESLSAG